MHSVCMHCRVRQFQQQFLGHCGCLQQHASSLADRAAPACQLAICAGGNATAAHGSSVSNSLTHAREIHPFFMSVTSYLSSYTGPPILHVQSSVIGACVFPDLDHFAHGLWQLTRCSATVSSHVPIFKTCICDVKWASVRQGMNMLA